MNGNNAMFSSVTPPSSVARCCQDLVPLLSQHVSEARLTTLVAEIVATDRANSFDRFQRTTDTLMRRLKEAGALTDRYTIQTGGEIGTGHWIIQEAADIRAATVDIIQPIQQRIVDYAANPWGIVQWSSSTPSSGVECELVVIDSYDELDRIPPDGLRGKLVLTRLFPYQQGRRWHEKGAFGVLIDTPVPACPDATIWAKFGWGGMPVHEGTARLVGCVISAREGDALRALVQEGVPVTLHVQVDVHRYVGTHDVVSGLVVGADDPQDEVWAIAHSSEPGAADNAAGVAACIEAVTILESLIAAGQLSRPRRSIRVVFGYECYGFFHYLINQRRFQSPLAGICVDTLGIKPDYCAGALRLHATVPSSAGFVNELAEAMIQAALTTRDTGYTYQAEAFISTEDTLIGDPRYGFPCPLITNHPYRGYHSSADTPEILHPGGLAACVAAIAAYLYYLANADSPVVRELAVWHTERMTAALREVNGAPSRDTAELLRRQHDVSMRQLSRWLWGGNRAEMLSVFDTCHQHVVDASADVPTPVCAQSADGASVPRRRFPLTYMLENTWPAQANLLRESELPSWALYWADGDRCLDEIARLLSAEHKREIPLSTVVSYFLTLQELGWVDVIMPEMMIHCANISRRD